MYITASNLVRVSVQNNHLNLSVCTGNSIWLFSLRKQFLNSGISDINSIFVGVNFNLILTVAKGNLTPLRPRIQI